MLIANIVDDEPAAAESVWHMFLPHLPKGSEVRYHTRAEEVIRRLDTDDPSMWAGSVIFIDLRFDNWPGEGDRMAGYAVLSKLAEKPFYRQTVKLVITGFSGAQEILRVWQEFDVDGYLEKPLESADCEVCFRQKIAPRLAELNAIRQAYSTDIGLIAVSPGMSAVVATVKQLAPTSAHVLITGETGTGKELIAKALHAKSLVNAGPLITVNCAALPEALIESELFGSEKGGFTGAQKKRGHLELANNGTLFFDEVGEMSLSLQAKVLRALEEGEIRHVGGTTPIQTNFRLLSATHCDLEAMVKAASFREDLYYRLNVLSVHIPPLRDRPEDILPLAFHFLRRFAEKSRLRPLQMSADAQDQLLAHSWPGNVRELRNNVERLAILAAGPTITASEVANVLQRPASPPPRKGAYNLIAARDAVERACIADAMHAAGNNVTEAAKLLGIARQHVHRLLKRHNLTGVL